MTIEGFTLITVAVGNSRTRLGRFEGRALHDPVSLTNTDGAEAIAAKVRSLADESADGSAPPQVVLASVNDPFAGNLETLLLETFRGGAAGGLWRAGRDVPIEMPHTLDDASTVGADRWLNALGASRRAGQACVVIDAGTAVTVDFVDGEGVFHGGVIAPGVRLMLRSMSEGAAALPELDWDGRAEFTSPFGQSTAEAMTLGAISAVRGLMRERLDAYAEHYGGYPQIVATGGDAVALFEDSDLIEHIVPDLQLIGIQAACERALSEDSDREGFGAAAIGVDFDQRMGADGDG